MGKLKEQIHIDSDALLLNQVCVPLVYSPKTKSIMGNVPVITFFSIPDAFQDVLQELTQLSSSYLFKKEWGYNFSLAYRVKQDKEGENTVLTLEELYRNVWEPTNLAIKEIIRDLQQGTMALKKVKTLFKRYRDDYKELHKELVSLYNNSMSAGWISERVEQIQQFHKINTYKTGAEQMKRVVKSLKLEGDYRVLDTLLSTVCYWL